jgi:hypothetical protein
VSIDSRKFLLSVVVDFKFCLLSIMNAYTPQSQQDLTKICESQITNISLLCAILWNAVFMCGSLALRVDLEVILSHQHFHYRLFMYCRKREVLVIDTFR